MPITKALLTKHKHHIEILARGKPHERAYVIKTAPASLEPISVEKCFILIKADLTALFGAFAGPVLNLLGIK